MADIENFELEVMPEELITQAMEMTGLDREDVLRLNEAGQRIRNYAMDVISDGDKITMRELAIAGVACKMAGSWLEMVVIEIASEEETEDA